MHIPTSCDQCGQTDDHPKLHYANLTFHHDCVPISVVATLDATNTEIVRQCRSGIRGDALRNFIQGA